MYEIRKTDQFVRWIDSLRDIRAKARILVRIERLREGNAGDVRPVGEGVSELRIDHGPGYRVYYVMKDGRIVILLAGGSKKTQSKDIELALSLASNV